MQSLSHWDLKTVFVQRFLSEATFIPFLHYILQFFTQKTFFMKSLKKKKNKKQTVPLVQCCKHLSSTKYSCKKKPPKGLEKGHNGNNPNLSVRK